MAPKGRTLTAEHRRAISEGVKAAKTGGKCAAWVEARRRGSAKRACLEAGVPLWRALVDRACELLGAGTPRDIMITDLQRKWQCMKQKQAA